MQLSFGSIFSTALLFNCPIIFDCNLYKEFVIFGVPSSLSTPWEPALSSSLVTMSRTSHAIIYSPLSIITALDHDSLLCYSLGLQPSEYIVYIQSLAYIFRGLQYCRWALPGEWIQLVTMETERSGQIGCKRRRSSKDKPSFRKLQATSLTGEQLWEGRMRSCIWDMNLMNPWTIQRRCWLDNGINEPEAGERELGWRGGFERLPHTGPNFSRGHVWGQPRKEHSVEKKRGQDKMRDANF